MSHPSRLGPRFDALEARVALSTATAALPTLTLPEYLVARARIATAVARLAATGNEGRADAALVQAVRTVPDGPALLPVLRSDLASADLTTRGSALAERQQLWGDLDDFIASGVDAGAFAVAGRALQRRFAPPVDGGGTTPSGGQGGTTPSGGQGGTTPSGGQGGTTPSGGQVTVINFTTYNQTGRAINIRLSQANNSFQYNNQINNSTPSSGYFFANPTPPSVIATATANGYNTAFAPVPLATRSIVVGISATNPNQLTITTYT